MTNKVDDILITDFKNYVNEQETFITMQVYMELCEVKRYYDVSYIYNNNLDKIILVASKTKNESACAFVPIQVQEELTFLKIRQICLLLKYATIYIVIVHPDSTCVYYQVKDGLMEPTEFSAKHLKEKTQENLDANLKKNRNILQHAALMGVTITLKEEEQKM